MRSMPVRLITYCCILSFVCLGTGCSKKIESDKGIEAMMLIDEYEDIIARYEYDFEEAGSNAGKLIELTRAYNDEVKEWSEKWKDLQGEIDPDELAILQDRLDKLNDRVQDMLRTQRSQERGSNASKRFGRVTDEF